MTSDYKKYSLEKLQEWVHDAMNSDASPHEIYSAIREAVREDYYYHKDCISRASGLLELLSGHRPVKSDDSKKWDAWEEHYYPEEYKESVNLDKEIEEICKQGGYEWTPLPTQEPQGKSEYYYDCDRNDPNRKNPFKDKVVKWQLPIEVDPSGEYFVSFPDDLLEAANLKEGDTVEWVEQSDGSYLLRKV